MERGIKHDLTCSCDMARAVRKQALTYFLYGVVGGFVGTMTMMIARLF